MGINIQYSKISFWEVYHGVYGQKLHKTKFLTICSPNENFKYSYPLNLLQMILILLAGYRGIWQ